MGIKHLLPFLFVVLILSGVAGATSNYTYTLYESSLSDSENFGTLVNADTTFTAVNITDLTKDNGYLKIDIRVSRNNDVCVDSDPEQIGIEVTSTGGSNSEEWTKVLDTSEGYDFSTTYQTFIIPLSDFSTVGGELDVTGINYLNVYGKSYSSAGLTIFWKNASIIYEFTNSAPVVSNLSPSDGAISQTSPTLLSCDITDVDMGSNVDTVTATFYVDGVAEGTDTITSNGTASAAISGLTGGSHDWYVIAEDAYGASMQSSTYSISVPATFYIRDATNISKTVSDAEVTVRFYEYGDASHSYIKTTSTGYVDLTGLPVDSVFVAVVNADGYNFRNAVIQNIFEQDSIYLIPNTSATNEVTFTLTDYTGRYPASDTILYIQRPINTSLIGGDGVEWVTMSGDYLGADQEFETTLIDEERYRITVTNSDGESRVAGQYNSLNSETVDLVIGQLEWDIVPDTTTYSTQASFENTTDEGELANGVIRFQYDDPADLTTALTISVYEEDNETNVIYTDTTTGTLGEYSTSVALDADDLGTHYIVSWEVTRDGETIEGEIPVRTDAGYFDTPIDGPIGKLLFGGLFVFVAVIFGGIYSSRGAVISVGLVALLWFFGIRFVSIGIIIMAGIVALLFHISDRGEGGL